MCRQGSANLVSNLPTPAPRIIAFKEADVLLTLPPFHTHMLARTQTLSFSLSLCLSFSILFTVSLPRWLSHYSFSSMPCSIPLYPSPHSQAHISVSFSLPHPFSFFPHFKTDDLLMTHASGFFFFLYPPSHLQRRILAAVVVFQRPSS